MKKETAFFGAGCVWGVELAFSKIKGVLETEVGYMGGKETEDVNYEKVCSGKTGHAETEKEIFDADKTSYMDLLELFWELHDPTQVNRQGADLGTQYRSVIFYSGEKQKKTAIKSKEEKQKKTKTKIATEIASAGKFYKAEEYHQKYLEKKGAENCR